MRPIMNWMIGEKVPHESDGEPCKIMAVADGYIMLRRPRKMPFVISFKTATEWWMKWSIS